MVYNKLYLGRLIPMLIHRYISLFIMETGDLAASTVLLLQSYRS